MSTESIQQQIDKLEKQKDDILAQLVSLKRQRTNNEQIKNYELLDFAGNSVSLLDMFGDKNDLIVIHNMGKGCNYCTLWADGFNGFAKPFADRAAFVLVSPDSPEVQQEFAESRGWTFQMASSQGSTFTSELGFSEFKDGKQYYAPGYSTFRKNPDGSITRAAYDYFGPGDLYCAVWHIFELLPEGVENWHPKKVYA
ncbi:MAG: DUF899 family protein [Ignavibacteria bacterium]|nr:DUF899 family protein [Ignavibacteria bacterium]